MKKAELQQFDRKRKDKKVSNDDWENPHDPDATVTRMKNGTTRLAYKAEHAVDLESDLIMSATMHTGIAADTETVIDTAVDVTAESNQDGSVTIHFGGDPAKPNYLPITPGWNYIVRMYQPKVELLDGSWKFPDCKAAE